MCIKWRKGKIRREEYLEGKIIEGTSEQVTRREKKGRREGVKKTIQLNGCVVVYKQKERQENLECML